MELFFTMLVPLIIAAVALYGMARRVDVYDALVQGAGEGLGVLLRIVPPLVGLLTAVYMLRASGALELAARALAPVLTALGIPPETVALLLVRPVSGSAALGVGAELIATYGPDSLIGRTAAVMLGSTETTFYTIAVYFGAAGIVKTRYAVPGSPLRRPGGLYGCCLGGAGDLLLGARQRNRRGRCPRRLFMGGQGGGGTRTTGDGLHAFHRAALPQGGIRGQEIGRPVRGKDRDLVTRSV